MDITPRGRSGSHAAGPEPRPGWGPTPRSGRSYSAAGRPEGGALRALRVVTYVLASLASIAVLVALTWAGITLYRLHGAIQGDLGRVVTGSAAAATPGLVTVGPGR